MTITLDEGDWLRWVDSMGLDVSRASVSLPGVEKDAEEGCEATKRCRLAVLL